MNFMTLKISVPTWS